MRKIGLFIVLISLLLFVIPRDAFSRSRVVLLGIRTVDFALDHDEILVTNVQGMFRGLEFKVSGNDLEIFNMVVIYANGSHDTISTKLVFREGEWSRAIDLQGGRRFIQKITFNYRSLGSLAQGKAVVKVFGIR